MEDIRLVLNEILKLKEEKNAIILGHFYQTADIQEISDFVGADTVEILQKINDEKIECGFVIGSDPADVYPDREYINKALV